MPDPNEQELDQKLTIAMNKTIVELSIEELQSLKELAAWWQNYRPKPQRNDPLIPPDIIGGKG